MNHRTGLTLDTPLARLDIGPPVLLVEPTTTILGAVTARDMVYAARTS